MKSLIKILICLLELLQKFPYEKVIVYLRTLHSSENSSKDKQQKVEINFKHRAIFIDNVEIISKEAENLHKIFRIFFDQFLLDAIDGKDCADFKLFSINEITEILEKIGLTILDSEKQVRRQINRLQKIMINKLEIQLIESIHWPGVSNRPFGYRLNPKLVCFGAKDTNFEKENV